MVRNFRPDDVAAVRESECGDSALDRATRGVRSLAEAEWPSNRLEMILPSVLFQLSFAGLPNIQRLPRAYSLRRVQVRRGPTWLMNRRAWKHNKKPMNDFK